ncbi:ATP-binding cassette domain-containing protein [Rhodococcus sp. IEGM 1379]|uniref:ABC transporter ATP-binding protein n=1 Tax=Rhodococcus sp. IEGM 1379 TaxID=3047086 RepID=UPI0024B872B5|nr:ATP-binding cassette domain-containing protein [Rhodococcus sp. IEGM 1379]MDI9913991.1 ATP-binding cassette domain-containing protein [Rhodococcus sp. IEGM 1379]
MTEPSTHTYPIMNVDDVHIVYPGASFGSKTHAVRGITLEVVKGETLGLVGESGSGKSSLARAMAGLEKVHAGSISYLGQPLPSNLRLPRSTRLDLQMVFQDPGSALNRRRRIGSALADALGVRTGKAGSSDAVATLLESVGLPASFAHRYPSEASGGQLQRVVIARALAAQPQVLIADEPVSALDVSVQAQVLDLLVELRARLELTIVFVSHDLGVVRHMCDRIAVMRNGLLVEIGDAEQVVTVPSDPYTQMLLDAVPDLDEFTHVTAN